MATLNDAPASPSGRPAPASPAARFAITGSYAIHNQAGLENPEWIPVSNGDEGILTELPSADLLLAVGPEVLPVLARQGYNGPVTALTADSRPEMFALSGVAETAEEGRYLLPGREFWKDRLRDFAKAVQFKRLGYIRAPSSAPAGRRMAGLAVCEAAADLRAEQAGQAEKDGTETFDFFVFELEDTSAEQCRAALDDLFFDEVDALVLDGCACFAPEREDLAELADLLRQRGMLPLSLSEPALPASTGQGVQAGQAGRPHQARPDPAGQSVAVLGVGAEDLRRRGKALAAQTREIFFPAQTEQPPAGLRFWKSGWQTAFSLDLERAKTMGFAPAVWLLAISEIAR